MKRSVSSEQKRPAMKRFFENEIAVSNDRKDLRFRVYDLNAGTFYPESEELFLSSAGDRLLTKTGEVLSLKENVIQHCTGERDIKNRLIHLGDILRTDEAGWKAVVVWGDGRFCLEDERGGFSAWPNWNCCEIIGNIFSMEFHGSPDLAGEEEQTPTPQYTEKLKTSKKSITGAEK